MAIPKHSIAFTIFLGALSALPPLAIDMGLPALGKIAQALHCTDNASALTLSLFLAGFAFGPLICGPISDRFGRRPVLISGAVLFTLAGIFCALSAAIETLLFWRFVAGCGAGAASVLVMAVVRDGFEGHEARAKLSYVAIVRTMAPMIAPSIGAAILTCADWRTVYGAIAHSGLIVSIIALLGLEESHPREKRLAIRPSELGRNYLKVLRHPISCGYALVNAFNFGCIFSYVSGSPLVMMEVIHVPAAVYGGLFAMTAFGITIGALLNGKLSKRAVSHHWPLIGGLLISLTCCLLLLTLSILGINNLYYMMPLLVLSTFSMGLMAPNATHGTLHPLPEIAGMASAVLSAMQMIVGSLASALVAYIYDGTSSTAMTSVMAFFSILANLTYFFWVEPKERHFTIENA